VLGGSKLCWVRTRPCRCRGWHSASHGPRRRPPDDPCAACRLHRRAPACSTCTRAGSGLELYARCNYHADSGQGADSSAPAVPRPRLIVSILRIVLQRWQSNAEVSMIGDGEGAGGGGGGAVEPGTHDGRGSMQQIMCLSWSLTKRVSPFAVSRMLYDRATCCLANSFLLLTSRMRVWGSSLHLVKPARKIAFASTVFTSITYLPAPDGPQ